MNCRHCGSVVEAVSGACACGMKADIEPRQQQLDLTPADPQTEWKGEVLSRLQTYQQRRARRVADHQRAAAHALTLAGEQRSMVAAAVAERRRAPSNDDVPSKIIPFRRVAGEPLAISVAQREDTPIAPQPQPAPNETVATPRSIRKFRRREDEELATPVIPRDALDELSTMPPPGASWVGPSPFVPASGASTSAAPVQSAAVGSASTARRVSTRNNSAATEEDALAEPVEPPARERSATPVPLRDPYQPLLIEPAADGDSKKIEIRLGDEFAHRAPDIVPDGVSPFVRLHAGFVDACAITVGCLLFTGAAAMLVGLPALNRHALLRFAAAIAGVPTILASVYVLLCFHLGRATLGMRHCGLRICDFDGRAANRTAIRRRAWASLLSLGALGLGYLWMLIDDHMLTWHDHISETVVAEE